MKKMMGASFTMSINSTQKLGVAKTQISDILTKKMSYLAARGHAMAENIGNVDTPGYSRKDLKPFQELLRKSSGKSELEISSKDFVNTHTEVNRETESMRLAEVESEFRFISSILNKYMKLVESVFGKVGGR